MRSSRSCAFGVLLWGFVGVLFGFLLFLLYSWSLFFFGGWILRDIF